MVDYRGNPAVHLFGDGDAALKRLRRSAEAAGCRIASAARIDDATDPAHYALPGAALLIELDDAAAGEWAIPLLVWAEREAGRGGRAAVVSAPAALIDLVAARPADARLRDPGREDGAGLLRRVSEDVGRIAAMLATLSDRETGPSAEAAYVRAIIRGRRLRDQYFRDDLFADPAWDMLLDLMAARLEGKQVTVSSLCIAAAVPMTTALRWIKLLAAQGLIVRTADPEDGRRSLVALSEEGAATLGAYLRRARLLGMEGG